MSYRVNPADFVEALYGEEDAEDVEQPASDSEEVFGLYDEEEDETDLHEATPPVYSSLSPSAGGNHVQRDRSRSPVVKREFHRQNSSSPDIVIVTFDEVESSQLDVEDAVHPTPIDASTFWTPDAHALYVERIHGHEGDMGANDRYAGDRFESKRSVRGRIRGGRRRCGRPRRGQGSGRGGRSFGSQHSRWEVGHPLEEIWVNDNDVPSELINLAMDVVRKREMRAQQMRERRARRHQERDRSNLWEDSEGEDEEEFQDATDGRGLEGESLRFKWSPMDSFRGEEELFTTERTGSVEMYSTSYDAFRSYWDDSVIQHIVDKTNLYASKVSSAAFQGEWYPTNPHEVLCLFAFWMMLGIIRMPTIASCFSTEPLLKTDIFRRIFTFNRYRHLTRVLSFVDADPANVAVDPTKGDPAASSDVLYCLRPIISHLNDKFKANYIPSKDICIDESLTLWKGSLNFKQQCIWSQAARYGIKTFELCESATGYLWSFVVCTNKQNNEAIVKKLVNPLLNKGHRLFMDNWCNSPLLARFLKRNGTDYVGTLRSSCADVPVVINHAPLNQGQLIARHSGDVCVLSWQDQKRITMASTCHGSASAWATVPSKALSRPLPFKPQVVLDFNKWMGGVDLKDELLEPYLIERKRCNKWYMKLFKRLLNCSILNARILLQSSLKCPQDHLTFRLQIIDGILTNHLSFCPQTRRATSISHRTQHPARIVHHTHWPIRVEQAASDTMRNRQSRKLCTVCIHAGRKSKRTPFKCEDCDVPLCVENCFKIYHTALSLL